MRVSLVVCCYQEAEAVDAFATSLGDLPVDELVFVDDGSTDGTAAGLRRLAALDPRIRIETHAGNRGVGAAMRTGLAAARGQIVVVYDVDRTYPVGDVARLVAVVDAGADIATASPWMEGGAGPDVPFLRRVLSRGAAWAYRRALGPAGEGVATFTCAFRAYPRPWIERLAFESDGFGAAGEILGLALLEGAQVVEVPCRLGERQEGRSKMRVLRAMREHAGVLRRLRRRRRAEVTAG